MQTVRNERIRAKMTAKPAEAQAERGGASDGGTGQGERKRLTLKFGG
jgi:hypothetical protein